MSTTAAAPDWTGERDVAATTMIPKRFATQPETTTSMALDGEVNATLRPRGGPENAREATGEHNLDGAGPGRRT